MNKFLKIILFSIGLVVIIAVGFGLTRLMGLGNGPQNEVDRPDEQLVLSDIDTSSWKTYRNEEFGFEVKYPKDWYVYDEETWQNDSKVSPCDQIASIENTFILSKQDLGRCVGVVLWVSWPGELIIDIAKKEWPNFPYVLGKEEAKIIELSGITAVEYPFTEQSARPRKQATKIYANYAGKGYLIEFIQTDKKGNHDPIFDQILSTFRFII